MDLEKQKEEMLEIVFTILALQKIIDKTSN
jgi:hypothetical protein